MKKRIALVLIALGCVGLFSFTFLSKSGKAGYTGSPGENSCNYCHNTYALNSGTGSLSFSSNIPADIYTPDSIYHITLVVRQFGIGLFGFAMEALKTGNTNAGTFMVTNTTRTQILTAANTRKSMTHKLSGGLFNDSAVFNFDWKAPTTNVGAITFYFTGVSANQSNSNSGDYVYKGSHTISSTSTVGIESSEEAYADLEVRPFPMGQLIDVNFNLNEPANVNLHLTTMDGKIVYSAYYVNQVPGAKSYTILTSQLNAGIYILQAEINGVVLTRKFLLTQ